jgi:hypothetical protein
MSETKTVTEILRKQFPANEVGKLPRVTCGDCSDRRKNCDKHSKAKCQVCQSYVSTQHIHIDYVGHADVTTRLLEADPEWSWEPKARDIDPAVLAAAVATGNPEVVRMVLEASPPKFDLDNQGEPVGLWINLTVGGVTRPGFGSVPSGQFDAVKVLIGDSLRNAAMRFGVALDLWAKGDRADPAAENATASGGTAVRGGSRRESFDDARPARPAASNGHANGSPANGTVARPPAQTRTAPTGEVDPEAQPFADEAAAANSIGALREIHTRAREAHKLAALITDPSGSGHIDGLGKYLNHRKGQLEEVEKAFAALIEAAGPMPIDEVEIHVKAVTGKSVEGASAAEIKAATEALTAKAAA